MSDLDLAVRGGAIVSAADISPCDIGIKSGKMIVFIGFSTDAARTIGHDRGHDGYQTRNIVLIARRSSIAR